MASSKEIGTRYKRFRLSLGLTQKEMCENMNANFGSSYKASDISSYESGKSMSNDLTIYLKKFFRMHRMKIEKLDCDYVEAEPVATKKAMPKRIRRRYKGRMPGTILRKKRP